MKATRNCGASDERETAIVAATVSGALFQWSAVSQFGQSNNMLKK
jgi:hypothetical protein